MGHLTAMLNRPRIRAGDKGFQDRYYEGALVVPSAAGVPVTADTAMSIPAVWACVNLISRNVASLPVVVYRRVSGGGRERAWQNPLYGVLHDRPNALQTPYAWKQFQMVSLLLRGNGYSVILPSQTTPVAELLPLHPDRVIVEQFDSGQRGPSGLKVLGTRYRYRQYDGSQIALDAEDVFHLVGLSLDGYRGVSAIEYARETFGLSLAEREYGARFFGNGSSPRGVLKMAGKLSTESAARLKADWEAAHRGVGNSHRVAILEEGMEWQQISISPEDSQFLQSRSFERAEIASWFSVPPHMIGDTEKQTSWGAGVEAQFIGFLMTSLRPWLVVFEETIQRSLVLQPHAFYAEFLIEEMLRADIKTRYDAYAVARQWGWMSANDIRRRENLNPIEGGDRYLEALNMRDVGDPVPLDKPPVPAQLPPAPEQAARMDAGHYHMLVTDAAERIIRKETAALSKAAKRCAGDSAAWTQAVAEFYTDHTGHVAQTLRISRDAAERYTSEQQRALTEHGAAVMADWESRRVADLVALALEEYDAV